MRCTIQDVAARAGVSISTVSRVINGRDWVAQKTRARVQSAVKDLGYRPSLPARRMKAESRGAIGFLLGNRGFLHPFHSEILAGAEHFCGTIGWDLLYQTISYQPDAELAPDALPRMLRIRGSVDGVLLAGTHYSNLVDKIAELGIPYVIYGNNFITPGRPPEYDAVYVDDAAGSETAVRYLIEMGHWDIWFVGDISLPWFSRRFEGYRSAMQTAGLTPRGVTRPLSIGALEYGEAAAAEIFKNGATWPTAIFAGNDSIAYGIWRTLSRRRLGVPREVSLVGFDDLELGLLMQPQLTTVGVDKSEIGRHCASMLVEKIEHPGKRCRRVVLGTSLILRDSTARFHASGLEI